MENWFSGFCALAGTFVGAIASILTTVVTNNYESQEKRKAQESLRARRLLERQLNELDAIESLLLQWGRETAKYYLSIEKRLNRGLGGDARVLGDDASSEAARLLCVDIKLRSSRLLDCDLRNEIRDLTSGVSLSNDTSEIDAFLNRKVQETSAVVDKLAERRRQLLVVNPVDYLKSIDGGEA